MEAAERQGYDLDLLDGTDAWLALTPWDHERRVAGARRRREWFEEQMGRVLWAALAPHMKAPVTFETILGRKPGTSEVPGYREEPRG